jgi:hypothetical protein
MTYSPRCFGSVARTIALSTLVGLLSTPTVFAQSNQLTEFGGQKLMPIDAGVSLSWKIDCFWGEPISYGGRSFRAMGYANGQMFNFMDIEASYWPARFKLAPGEKLVLKGVFPHARYTSFNSYGGGAPTSSLVDKNIQPDRGSANPFVQGARRDTPDDQRRYTIYVINEPEPANAADRAPNTLYARPAAEPYDIVELRFRTYLVDATPQAAFDQRGGVPLPMPVSLVSTDGATHAGEAICKADRAMAQRMFFRAVPPETVSAWWEGYPCTDKTPKGQFCNDPFTAPAQNPPVTEKFFGIPYSLQGLHLPPAERAKLKPASSCKLAKGFEGNADNAYMMTFLNNRFGKVVVLRGRYPRTPRTYFDAAKWDESQTELRYWSAMSGNEVPSTQIAAGIADEQIPIGKDGYFSIVVSKPEDRPKSATQACGHAWLDWGRRGDFTGRDGQTVIAWRHTIPANGFDKSLLAVCEPGTEKQVMGDYLPTGRYFQDAAAFDAEVGCLDSSK